MCSSWKGHQIHNTQEMGRQTVCTTDWNKQSAQQTGAMGVKFLAQGNNSSGKYQTRVYRFWVHHHNIRPLLPPTKAKPSQFINGNILKSCRMALTNRTWSILHHITPLVSNALRGRHIQIPMCKKQKQFQETRHEQPSAAHTWFKNASYNGKLMEGMTNWHPLESTFIYQNFYAHCACLAKCLMSHITSKYSMYIMSQIMHFTSSILTTPLEYTMR